MLHKLPPFLWLLLLVSAGLDGCSAERVAVGPSPPREQEIRRFRSTNPTKGPVLFGQVKLIDGTKTYILASAIVSLDKKLSFTNAAGKSQYARYRITPVKGAAFITKLQAASSAPDYLFTELPKRLSENVVQYTLSAQLAEPEDVINDATSVWPEERKQVVLGTISLKQVQADGAQFEKATMFNPLILVDGIEASEDPILLARPAAYAVSYGRRLGH